MRSDCFSYLLVAAKEDARQKQPSDIPWWGVYSAPCASTILRFWQTHTHTTLRRSSDAVHRSNTHARPATAMSAQHNDSAHRGSPWWTPLELKGTVQRPGSLPLLSCCPALAGQRPRWWVGSSRATFTVSYAVSAARKKNLKKSSSCWKLSCKITAEIHFVLTNTLMMISIFLCQMTSPLFFSVLLWWWQLTVGRSFPAEARSLCDALHSLRFPSSNQHYLRCLTFPKIQSRWYPVRVSLTLRLWWRWRSAAYRLTKPAVVIIPPFQWPWLSSHSSWKRNYYIFALIKQPQSHCDG